MEWPSAETYTQGNKTIEFEYDENGLRHRKTVKENGIITERYDYVWSDGSLITQTYTTYSNGELDSINSAKFIYDAWGTLQGFVLNDTATYLYTKNLQGDILSIVNESGQTILTYSYDAWGAVTFSAISMQNMLLAYTLSFVSPFTYRGYCYDYDIELYYLQSRYYSAEIGRFINTDDTQIAIATQGEVLGANLFAYCNNNPVMNVDFTGTIAANVVGAVIGAIIGVVGGYFLAKWLAGKINFKYNWQRNAFIGGLTALVTASAAAIGYFVGPYVAKFVVKLKNYVIELIHKGKIAINRLSTSAKNSLKNMVKRYGFKSRGSTGRTIAQNLNEKLAMEQVKSNPLKYGKKLNIILKDSRWPASEGWVKMEAVIRLSNNVKIVIHFVYNTVYGAFDDFKFK